MGARVTHIKVPSWQWGWRLPKDPPGPDLPLCPSPPPACYILALVLSCTLTVLLLIRSLTTHRLVAALTHPGQRWEGTRDPSRCVWKPWGCREGRPCRPRLSLEIDCTVVCGDDPWACLLSICLVGETPVREMGYD